MKIFLSSTCYDLPDLRAEIEDFLHSEGHETLLSDREDFPVDVGVHRHINCINNVRLCDLFVLIINKRYGAPYHGDRSISITHAEFREALKSNKHIIAYVRRSIFDERMCYQKNHTAEHPYKPVFVDKNDVFGLIDEVQEAEEGVWLSGFESSVEVKKSLRQVFEILERSGKVKEPFPIIERLSRETQEYLRKRYGLTRQDRLTGEVRDSVLKRIPDHIIPWGELLGSERIPDGDEYMSFVPIRWAGDEGEVLVGIVASPLGRAIRDEIASFQ